MVWKLSSEILGVQNSSFEQIIEESFSTKVELLSYFKNKFFFEEICDSPIKITDIILR